MSLYNMMNGVNPATFYILPMLGYHPDSYPRFRDCFISDERYPDNNHIIVYTRTGGGNRESYMDQNLWITCIEGYIEDYDDDYDCTFANFVFDIPEKWKDDFNKIIEGNIKETSKEYQDQLVKVYPKLEEAFKEIFNS
jgi:hypothetical protein